MGNRIRNTFTALEKQKIAQAVLQYCDENGIKDDYKTAFFAIQSKTIRPSRTIKEDQWPSVERWIAAAGKVWADMGKALREETNKLIADKNKEIREIMLVNASLNRVNSSLEREVANLNKQLFALQTPTAVKKPKPKVVIAGLLHCQENIIKQKHDGAFKLSFVTSDQFGNGQMSDRMRNADKVILMTDFVSHNGLQSSLGDKVILVKGGMSSLHRALSDLLI